MKGAVCALAAMAVLAACATPPPVQVAPAFAGRFDGIIEQIIAQLQAKKDWRGLLALAEKGIKLKPDSGDWLFIACSARSGLDQYRRAIELCTEALRRNPEDIYALDLLGQSYQQAGDSEQAVRILERAITVKTDSPATFYLLGESYYDINLHARAASAYLRATQLDPTLTPAWYGLGMAYAKLDRRDDLLAVLERLRVLDPTMAEQLRQRAGNR